MNVFTWKSNFFGQFKREDKKLEGEKTSITSWGIKTELNKKGRKKLQNQARRKKERKTIKVKKKLQASASKF